MPTPVDFLLIPGQEPHRQAELLREVGFVDPDVALRRLHHLSQLCEAPATFASCLPMLLAVLRDAPLPDRSLVNFERFLLSVTNPEQWLQYLELNPRATEVLVRLFVGSQFLTEVLIQHPQYLRELQQHQRIAEFKSREQFLTEATAAVHAAAQPLAALRQFQRWELLRIGACDAFGLLDLRSVTRQLSLLAECVVQTVLDHVVSQADGQTSGLAVIALGKLGGSELNYSSDIDLVFVTDQAAESWWKIGQQLIGALTQPSPDGFLYRVDMRLRPWGRSGALVNTVAAHVDYLSRSSQQWERQAMLKARCIAGDAAVGREFLKRVEPLLFTTEPNDVRASVLDSRQKIEQDVAARGSSWGDVKSGRGSIRDIEFVVQYLQLIHGGLLPEVQSPNTLEGLVRLAEFGILHADEYRILSDAYGFLRTIEHSLQLMHARQTHVLPASDRELGWLARRLDFFNAAQLRQYYEQYSAAVRNIFVKYVRDGRSAAHDTTVAASPVGAHRRKMGQSYAEVFSEADVARHAEFLEQLSDAEPVAVLVDRNSEDTWRLTVIGRDQPGCLSIISGLMLAHGIDIIDGEVFTGILTESTPGRARRFVDAFVVRCVGPETPETTFAEYRAALSSSMRRLAQGQFEDVREDVLRAASRSVAAATSPVDNLFAVDVRVDNETSSDFTVLDIETVDTIGFLYELTNALTLSGVQIERVHLTTRDGRVIDRLHVTRTDGTRIVDPRQIQQLRAAIVLIKQFTHLLPRSPHPRRALRQFREFLEELFQRENWVEALSSLQRTDVLDALARLLGVSSFLWMDFLRLQHENLFPVVRDVEQLRRPRSADDLRADLTQRLQAADDAAGRRVILNAFKDREMFRVDMRHILGHCRSFTRFAAELTDVADVTVQAAADFCFRELCARHGTPLRDADNQPCAWSVCALGKCGGRELGYASDVELMFLFEAEGHTSGPARLPNSAFFEQFVQEFTQAITARQDGIFEIDTRLRPYGQAGSAAVSLDVFCSYFRADGAAWPFERQALVKLRPIGGCPEFGERVQQQRDAIVYESAAFDKAAMLAMREKQIRQLVAPGTINAKLSAGGLVDCEYLVQGLQLRHGGQIPSLRATNTREAIEAMRTARVLSQADYESLRSAHSFLRRLINALRVVRGNARDLTVPTADSVDFAFLARQLGYDAEVDRLQADLSRTLTNARGLLLRLL